MITDSLVSCRSFKSFSFEIPLKEQQRRWSWRFFLLHVYVQPMNAFGQIIYNWELRNIVSMIEFWNGKHSNSVNGRITKMWQQSDQSSMIMPHRKDKNSNYFKMMFCSMECIEWHEIHLTLSKFDWHITLWCTVLQRMVSSNLSEGIDCTALHCTM